MYIWEHRDWPHFEWDEALLHHKLEVVPLLQGRLLARTDAAPGQADLDAEMDALIKNAIRTSGIEAEQFTACPARGLPVQAPQNYCNLALSQGH